VLDRFLTYAKSKPGIWSDHNNEIAVWALEHRSIALVGETGTPMITGLPRSAA